MSQPFLHLRRRSCCPHPDSRPCVPSTVNPHLSSLALGSPAWPGSPLHSSTLGAQPSASGVCLPLAPCLSPSPRVSLFLCLCLCLSHLIPLCVCLSICPSLSPSLSLTFCLSVSHYLSLSLCLRDYLCLSASLSVSVSSNRMFLCFLSVLLQNHKISSP